MERRTLIAGAAGLLAAGAARAQAPAPAAPAAMSKVDAAAPGLPEAVRTHIRDTTAVGSQSLLISRIAKAKLRHPMTRQFADFEITEQDGLADVLKARLAPGAKPNGAVVPPADADLEAGLDGDGRAAVATFRDMEAGPEFEKGYVAAETAGHEKLLAIQDAYLAMADDEAETAIAKLVKGRVAEHLVILRDIARHLG